MDVVRRTFELEVRLPRSPQGRAGIGGPGLSPSFSAQPPLVGLLPRGPGPSDGPGVSIDTQQSFSDMDTSETFLIQESLRKYQNLPE